MAMQAENCPKSRNCFYLSGTRQGVPFSSVSECKEAECGGEALPLILQQTVGGKSREIPA